MQRHSSAGIPLRHSISAQDSNNFEYSFIRMPILGHVMAARSVQSMDDSDPLEWHGVILYLFPYLVIHRGQYLHTSCPHALL